MDSPRSSRFAHSVLSVRRARSLTTWRRSRRHAAPSHITTSSSEATQEDHVGTLRAYDTHFDTMLSVYGTPRMLHSKKLCHDAAMREAAHALRAAGDPAAHPTPRRILEVGSALGVDAVIFAQMCKPPVEVVALDACAACTEWARTNLRAKSAGASVSFITADCVALGEAELDRQLGIEWACGAAGAADAEGSCLFDLVVSLGTLHHLRPTALERVLRALHARTSARGVLFLSMLAFGAHSLMPRYGANGRRGKLRGLHVNVANSGDASCVCDAVKPIAQHCGAELDAQQERALTELLDPRSDVPATQREQALGRMLPGMVDAHTLADDGGGLGVELISGDEGLGIPRRFERHYTPEALRDVLVRAGWSVHRVSHALATEYDVQPEKHLIAVARPSCSRRRS